MIDIKKLQTYVWKEKKVYNSDNTIDQNEIKLLNCSKDQLQKYYDHCIQMLYNESPDKPGRYVLLRMVNHQRVYCNVELFIRYLRTINISQNTYFMGLRNLANNNKNLKESGYFEKLPLIDILDDDEIEKMPSDFHELNVGDIMSACLDKLGKFDKSHLTLAFILKQGLWFTEDESQELLEYDSQNNIRDRKEVVKERLNLRSEIVLKSNPKGLTFSQFRAMIQLKSKKYSELTTEQLVTLRDKLLFALEDDIEYHIKEWEIRKNQILDVAEYNNIIIDEKTDF